MLSPFAIELRSSTPSIGNSTAPGPSPKGQVTLRGGAFNDQLQRAHTAAASFESSARNTSDARSGSKSVVNLSAWQNCLDRDAASCEAHASSRKAPTSEQSSAATSASGPVVAQELRRARTTDVDAEMQADAHVNAVGRQDTNSGKSRGPSREQQGAERTLGQNGATAVAPHPEAAQDIAAACLASSARLQALQGAEDESPPEMPEAGHVTLAATLSASLPQDVTSAAAGPDPDPETLTATRGRPANGLQVATEVPAEPEQQLATPYETDEIAQGAAVHETDDMTQGRAAMRHSTAAKARDDATMATNDVVADAQVRLHAATRQTLMSAVLSDVPEDADAGVDVDVDIDIDADAAASGALSSRAPKTSPLTTASRTRQGRAAWQAERDQLSDSAAVAETESLARDRLVAGRAELADLPSEAGTGDAARLATKNKADADAEAVTQATDSAALDAWQSFSAAVPQAQTATQQSEDGANLPSPGSLQAPVGDPLRHAAALKAYRAGAMQQQAARLDGSAQAATAEQADANDHVGSANDTGSTPDAMRARQSLPGFQQTLSQAPTQAWAAAAAEHGALPQTLGVAAEPTTVTASEVRSLTAASEAVDVHRLSSQLAAHLSEGARRIELRVAPPGLGSLDIAVQVHGTQVNLTVRGEAPELSQHMQQNLGDLQKNLQEHGLDLGHTSFGGSTGTSAKGEGELQDGRPRDGAQRAVTRASGAGASMRLGASRVINVVI